MIPNLLKGQLGACITVERAIAISRNPNCRVVFIGDPADYQQIIYNYNMVVGSILLPDYDAMQLDTVGDINAFNNAYFFYLHSNNPSMFLATVLKAMNTGYNICLFFPHPIQDHYSIIFLSSMGLQRDLEISCTVITLYMIHSMQGSYISMI